MGPLFFFTEVYAPVVTPQASSIFVRGQTKSLVRNLAEKKEKTIFCFNVNFLNFPKKMGRNCPFGIVVKYTISN